MAKLYFIACYESIECKVMGPFATERERLVASRKFKAEGGNEDDNDVIWLDVPDAPAIPVVEYASNYSLGIDDEEATVDEVLKELKLEDDGPAEPDYDHVRFEDSPRYRDDMRESGRGHLLP